MEDVKVFFNLSDLLAFLGLCEATGFIEIKVPVNQLREKLQVIWDSNVLGSDASVKTPLSKSPLFNYTPEHSSNSTICSPDQSISSLKQFFNSSCDSSSNFLFSYLQNFSTGYSPNLQNSSPTSHSPNHSPSHLQHSSLTSHSPNHSSLASHSPNHSFLHLQSSHSPDHSSSHSHNQSHNHSLNDSSCNLQNSSSTSHFSSNLLTSHSPNHSPSHSSSHTPNHSPSHSSSHTPDHSPSHSSSILHSPSHSSSFLHSPSHSSSILHSPSHSSSHSPNHSPRHSSSHTPNHSPSHSSSILHSPSHSSSHTPDHSPSHSSSILHSPNHSPSHSSNILHSPNHSLSHSFSHTPNHSPSHSSSHTPNHSPSQSSSHTPNHSPSHSSSHTPNYSPNHSSSHSPDHSPSHSSSHLQTSHSPNHSPSHSSSHSPSHSPSHSSSILQTSYSPNHSPNYSTIAPTDLHHQSSKHLPIYSLQSTPLSDSITEQRTSLSHLDNFQSTNLQNDRSCEIFDTPEPKRWDNDDSFATQSHSRLDEAGRSVVASERKKDRVSSSSSDSDNDDKLEKLFSRIKIQSDVKKGPRRKIISRESLSTFIVSDSENVSEDDDAQQSIKNTPPPCSPVLATPTYLTPFTPNTGVMFWGSPTHSTTSLPRYRGKKSLLSTPVNRNIPPSLQLVTTPSAAKNFSRFKNKMITEVFSLFNESVFENKLPVDTEVKWNKRLRTTAGYCYYLGTPTSRTARIELSNKVVDSYDRLQSTLVHEMCHAATWIIDGMRDGGHGPQWIAWARKVADIYPGISPVTRCHSYDIQYKYNYQCVNKCGFKIGRHSKTVNLETARCPYCLSYLEYIPRLKADGTLLVKKKLNSFAQFVKEHYSEVKTCSPWRSHKDVMQRVKELYYEQKEGK